MTPRTIDLWFVHGFARVFFTKQDAEAFARKALPEEGESERYARVYYRTYTDEKEL